MIGVGWFITHPKEAGESLLRGKRGRMFALCVVAVPLTVVCILILLLFIFGT
jgi:cell division protein FtsX